MKELSFIDQLAPLWDQLEALWRQSSESNPPLEDLSRNEEDDRVTKSDAEESESDNQTEGKDDVANNQDGLNPIEELLVVEEDLKKREEVETRKSDDGRGEEDSLKEPGSSSRRDLGIQTKEGEEDFGVKETNLMVDGEENGRGEEVLKDYVQDGGGVNQEEETMEDSGLEISEHQDTADGEDVDFMKVKEGGQDAKGSKVKKKGKGAKERKVKKNGKGADIRKAKEDDEGAKAIEAKEDGEVMEGKTKSEEEVGSLPPRVLILWTDPKLHEEVRRSSPLVSMDADSGWGL